MLSAFGQESDIFSIRFSTGFFYVRLLKGYFHSDTFGISVHGLLRLPIRGIGLNAGGASGHR
jgi:hypothetical protein